MKTMAFCLGVGLVLGLARCASAAPLADSYCHDFAERWYQQAVALGSETPDGVYEQAEADCEYQLTEGRMAQAVSVAAGSDLDSECAQ